MKTIFFIQAQVFKTFIILFTAITLFHVSPVFSDQVFLDDTIIDGSGCIGFDCVNGEDFGFDTLRLKENNLRIQFQDTSTSASFPSNDWRITINDSNNGGDNFFSVDDVTGDRTPFKIMAGAKTDAVVIDDAGQVGIGTNTPAADFHVQGNVIITGNLEMGSSRDYKTNIRDLELNEAVDALKALRPVKYNHKSQPEEETLGFIAEEVPDLVATNKRKSISPVDLTAVLTMVTQKQQETIESLIKRINALEEEIQKTKI